MNSQYYPELDENVSRFTLPNGLTVAVVQRRGFSKSLAYFATDFGSIHTRFQLDGQSHRVPDGVAHYLEHKLFDMPDGRDVTADFAALGASVNAFTGYDMTAYYFSCTEHFAECLRLLLTFVSTPYFTEETVSRELGIIDQEIDMNLDAPDSVIFENLMQSVYRRHPIRVPILGTSETIREITPEILYLCHRAFYTPANMILCVVGDVEPESVAAMAEEILGDARREPGRKIRDWAEDMTCPEPETECQMEVAMPTFSLAFKAEPLGTGQEAIRQEMIADLAAEILFGESSELYLQLYEAGTIDSSFGGGFETVDGCAFLTASGDSETPETVRDALIRAAADICGRGIDDDSFRRVRRSALGRRIRSLDSFDSTCFRVCAYHTAGFDYFRFPEIYRSIRKEDILQFLARVVTAGRCSLSVITPLQKESSYESQ